MNAPLSAPVNEEHSKLQNSEERWRNLVDGSLQGILIHRGARLLFANQTLIEMLGYASSDDLLACQRSIDLVVPADRGRIKEYLLGCTRDTTPANRVRVTALRKDGSTFLAENAARVIDWDGEPALQSTILDISEQQQAELALRENEERYRELAAAGSDWYWETDAEHRFVHISGRIKAIAGADPQTMIGKTRFELSDTQSDVGLWQQHWQDLDQHRPFRDFIYPGQPRFTGGQTHYFKISGTPRFSHAGSFLGYRGRAADVTAQEQARRRALTAEQRFIDALESSTDSFALYDANGCFVVSNAAWHAAHSQDLGHIPQPGDHIEKFLRNRLKRGVISEAIGREEQWLRERMARFHDGNGRYESKRSDGRWLQVRDHRTPDGSTIVTTSEITAQKNREAELKHSEQRFRDFAASASDWYYETDAELRVTYLSERFTEITGRPREQSLGHKIPTERPDAMSESRWQRHLDDLNAHRAFRNFDYQRTDNQGVIHYLRTSGLPRFSESGEFQGYRGIGLDNSKAIQIRQTEERFRDVIETISDGYALFDADDRLQIYNRNWLELTADEVRPAIKPGIQFEELLRLNLEHGHWPRAAGNEQKWLATRLRYHRECTKAFEVKTRNNHWYLIRERRTRNQGVLLTTSDITERKLREQALERSESRFRDFAETAADWFWELDTTLCFSFVSQRFHDITGLEVGRISGTGFRELMNPESLSSPEVGMALTAFQQQQPIEDLEFGCPDWGRGPTVHSISGLPLHNADGEFLGYRGTGRDITQARELSVRLAYQASHDELTGLVNRREFEQRLTRTLESSRHGSSAHALCYLDLDQFKVVNDTCGHAAGDALLQQLSRLLKDRVRGRDTLARLGGDEFALLLEHCTREQAIQIANNLLAAIEAYEFNWYDKRFRVGVSIGLVPIDNASSISATEILRSADSACYMAKDLGRNRIHIYTTHDSQLAHRESEMQWVSQLTAALADNRFVLYGQTIRALNPCAAEPSIPRYEILLRMQPPSGDIIAPGAFLPAAERYGLANRIDRWVVDRLFEWIDAHPRSTAQGCQLSINLSAQSIGDEIFQSHVIDLLHSHHFPAQQICFEITETTAIADLGAAQKFMNTLRAQGCRFALDDFGSGLSSYAALRDLPVDYLKIDGSFIRNLLDDPVHLAMVRSINDIGHVMGKQTVAEYVQDQATADQLSALGVDYAQGFGIGKPAPLDTLREG